MTSCHRVSSLFFLSSPSQLPLSCTSCTSPIIAASSTASTLSTADHVDTKLSPSHDMLVHSIAMPRQAPATGCCCNTSEALAMPNECIGDNGSRGKLHRARCTADAPDAEDMIAHTTEAAFLSFECTHRADLTSNSVLDVAAPWISDDYARTHPY